MEVKEFAETVLLGDNLESKFISPKSLSDLVNYSPIKRVPIYPGRPKHLLLGEAPVLSTALKFDDKSKNKELAKVKFPSLKDIETSDLARGQVMHFFANHELLAMEIMALMLLKYPDAPKDFRSAIVKAIGEEQEHLQAYIDSMNAFGVDFGELKVNDNFWKLMRVMESPLDFVTHMSLTFEQANLDFALQYKNIFAKIGDKVNADVLQKVYDDEIGHVALGLRWFRKWADVSGGKEEWRTYKHLLRFPMNPIKAKGMEFSRDARKRCGFKKEFIDELSLFRFSRGRSPDVYFFYPFIELEHEKGEVLKPNKALMGLGDDLGPLSFFMASNDDFCVLNKAPSKGYLKYLDGIGQLCDWGLVGDDQRTKSTVHFRNIKPWGWSAGVYHELSSEIAKQSSKAVESMPSELSWSKSVDLSSKGFQWGLRKSFLKSLESKNKSDFNSVSSLGQVVDNSVDCGSMLDGLGSNKNYLLKRSFSASGRGALRHFLREDSDLKHRLSQLDLEKVKAAGGGVLEELLDRVLDFSFCFEREAGGSVRFVGHTVMVNDDKGAYKGSFVGAFKKCIAYDFESRKEELIAKGVSLQTLYKALYFNKKGVSVLESVTEDLKSFLEIEINNSKYSDYVGALGIDAFLFVENGLLKMNPFVELNVRMTMGRFSLGLSKFLKQNDLGFYSLHSVKSEKGQRICEEFEGVLSSMGENEGLMEQEGAYNKGLPAKTLKSAQAGHVELYKSGRLYLGDPSSVGQFLPIFELLKV